MRKRVLASVLAAALVAVSFAACGNQQQQAPAASEEENAANEIAEEVVEALTGGYHFEIVSKGFQHQYWQAVLKGSEEMAAELGDTINFVGPASESDIADQVQMLTSAINQSPVAIGLASLDTKACLDAIQSAYDQGIPIVGFDSGVPEAPEGSVWANCSTDNYAAGELAAEMVWEAIADQDLKGKRIGVLAQDATSESVVNRGLGFIDMIGTLAELEGYTVGVTGNDRYVSDSFVDGGTNYDITIEVLVPAQVTSELSAIDCQNLLNKADTIAIYGSNQHSGEAMVTANETLQKFGTGEGKIIGAAFDSGAVIKEAVANGTFLGAVTQAPVAMGAKLVELLHAIAEGATIDEVDDVDTGCQWYTADNMDDPEIAQNLYD